MKKSTIVIMAVMVFACISVLPFIEARSTNPCSQCHSSNRAQYLDIVETDARTVLPPSLDVGETATVTVVVENQCSVDRYSTLTSVTLTLSSQNGRVRVTNPAYSVGTLPIGTRVATWQITGISAGSDTLTISTRATNTHERLTLTDTFSPAPSITVSAAPLPTTFTVAVTVTDSTTQGRLSGASVTLGTSQVTTSVDGAASFTVGAGTYQLSISKEGYTPTSESITVASNTILNKGLAPSQQTQTYTVSVSVTDVSTTARISGANVSIGGTLKAADSNGVALFTVLAGVYPMEIGGAGYNSTSEIITVAGDVSLSRSLAPIPVVRNYDVSIMVVDSETGRRLPGASVAVDGVTRISDPLGTANFTLAGGSHFVEITKDGYDYLGETLDVAADTVFSRALEKTPPAPATNLDPLIGALHVGVVLSSYVLVFSFAAYSMVVPGRSRGMNRLGFSSWLITLLALGTEVLTLNNESAGVWSTDWVITLLVFFAISGSMLALSENRLGLSLILALASCAPVLYTLPYEFGIAGAALLVFVYAVRLDKGDDKSPEAIRTRQIAIKLNRFMSWVFIVVSVVNLATGYAVTRLNLGIDELVPLHDNLSYLFAGLLAIHVILSLISGYPWTMIIRNVMDRRTGYFVALLLQEATAVLLLVLSAFQFLTGLGWVRDDVAALLPVILHIDADGLLTIALIIHGMLGIRFVLMRRRRRMPGGDAALAAVTVALIAAVLLLKG